MASPSGGPGSNDEPPSDHVSLPEVPLYWTDFVWSLEKLRHRAYSRKMTEHDWYRINPLEMVLLGCQTLADDTSACRDHGTFIMRMENLREKMYQIPRYWRRAIAVLSTTIKGPETPSIIIQRCAAGVVNLWQGANSNKLLRPSFVSWAVVNFKLLDLVNFLLTVKKKCLSPSTSEDILNIALAIQEMLAVSKDLVSEYQSQSSMQEVTVENPVAMSDLFISILQSSCKDIISLPFSVDDELKCSYLILLASIKDDDWSSELFLSSEVVGHILGLVNCLSFRTKEFDESLLMIFNVTALLASSDADQSLISSLFMSLAQLFEERAQQLQDNPLLSLNLLELVYTILLSRPIEESLLMAREFVTDYVRLLMTYSMEGYLSDNPMKFFLQLVEFVISLVEQGTPPSLAIQINLANLFGPFFGVNSHRVSTALLEYGFLSFCSKHKAALLTDGLQHIVNVWKLFPSVDKDFAQRKALRFHNESLEVCVSIIDDVVDSIFTDDTSSDMITEYHDDGSPGDPQDALNGEANEITETERQKDKHERIVVLAQLLHLACSMVRNGDNVCYMFASVLPRLFSMTPPSFIKEENRAKLIKFFGETPPPRDTSLMWRVDKKKLAICLLSLSSLSLENEMSTPFEICAIVMPKLARNLDTKNFTDEEKLSLSIDILTMTKEALQGGHNIEEFISHGLELLSSLLPQSISADELKAFTQQLVQQLVTSGYSSLLFFIRNACVYMLHAFPEETDQIQRFFHTLVFKGKRNEIRSVFKVCRNPFNEDLYEQLRSYLYIYGRGEMNNRQLLSLCEIILATMDVTKSPSGHQIQLEEEELIDEERNKRETKRLNGIEVMRKLVQPCLVDIDQAFVEKRFKKEFWESKLSELSRLALFRTLFSDELHEFHQYSSEELKRLFASMFPAEVLDNKEAMDILSLAAMRIEHMQVPRYSALKTLLTKTIKTYLTSEDLNGLSPTDKLLARDNHLINSIMNMERNSNDFHKLTNECFYSEQFWNKPFSLTVKTDGSHSLEENMRQTLLACYTEFTNILKEMNITHVSVNGELVKSVNLFSDELTLSELKGHRSVAVRAIDHKLGGTREGRIHERKVALLAQEDDIESDFEKQAKAPIKPKTFTASLNMKFLDCVKCCGGQIIGCYAPNGEHCERPLEIGIRADSGFLSIYDENGIEIENCEILLCNEGVYVFKAYTNGHPYDTSQVWIQVFSKLLEGLPENHSLSLVPAIIIPQNYPNQKTWDLLRRSIQPELTGSILTCQHDFSAEWRTYYDHRPEKVRCGVDMILHPGFSLASTGAHRPVYGRQRSRITKDLAGLIFEDVMSHLLESEELKPFRFLGKYMSQYISVLVEEGEGRTDIISKGFDYERWVKTQTQSRRGEHKLLSKDNIVTQLVTFIEDKLIQWCLNADVELMCEQNHKQLLQMRTFLGKQRSLDQVDIAKKYSEIQAILKESTVIVPMGILPRATQEELIHWIYHNEDRVWRYRGGRCGHETLQQFMGFIGSLDNEGKGKVYPGVCSFILPRRKNKDVSVERDFCVDSLVGYSIGEMNAPLTDTNEAVLPNNCYEVVLGWVNPKYQKLNLSINMYFSIIRHAPAPFILCDVIQGSFDRIIASNPLLRFMDFIGLAKYIVWRRQQSYSVQLQTGGTEQFEQVIFRVWPIRLAMWFERCFKWILFWRHFPQPLILDCH